MTSRHHIAGVVYQSDVTDHFLGFTGISVEREKIQNKKRLVTKVDYKSINRVKPQGLGCSFG